MNRENDRQTSIIPVSYTHLYGGPSDISDGGLRGAADAGMDIAPGGGAGGAGDGASGRGAMCIRDRYGALRHQLRKSGYWPADLSAAHHPVRDVPAGGVQEEPHIPDHRKSSGVM